MLRLHLRISPTRVGVTPNPFANRYGVIRHGLRNSSVMISPGWMRFSFGGSLIADLSHGVCGVRPVRCSAGSHALPRCSRGLPYLGIETCESLIQYYRITILS